MADRPRGRGGPEEGTPEYDWLYGSRGRTGSGGPDDETQVIRRPEDGAEQTRRMPAVGPAGSTGAGSARGPRQQPPPPKGPRRPPAAAEPSSPRRRPRPRLGWLKLVLLLWLVFLVAVPFWAWSKVTHVDSAPPDGSRPDEQDGTTYLVVGSDSREDLSEEERRELGTGNAGGRRTDTIMLLHTGSGPNLLMSIPRDSLVAIPGYGEGQKINAAFAYGGPRLLTRTVEQNTGIRVDHYVEIGFGGFVDVVDALGGVEICPRTAMKDKQANLDVAKGCQEADGTTALGYARSRKLYAERGDIDRARAQREVIAAIGDKALSPWSVLNPLRYYRLNVAGAESLRVSEDTGVIDVGRFALAMTRVDGKDGLTCSVPISDLAVNWDPERSEQLFQHIIDDDTDSVGRQLCTPTGMPPQ